MHLSSHALYNCVAQVTRIINLLNTNYIVWPIYFQSRDNILGNNHVHCHLNNKYFLFNI